MIGKHPLRSVPQCRCKWAWAGPRPFPRCPSLPDQASGVPQSATPSITPIWTGSPWLSLLSFPNQHKPTKHYHSSAREFSTLKDLTQVHNIIFLYISHHSNLSITHVSHQYHLGIAHASFESAESKLPRLPVSFWWRTSSRRMTELTSIQFGGIKCRKLTDGELHDVCAQNSRF